MKNNFIFILIAIMHGILHCSQTSNNSEFEAMTERIKRMGKTRPLNLSATSIPKSLLSPRSKSPTSPHGTPKLSTAESIIAVSVVFDSEQPHCPLDLIPPNIQKILTRLNNKNPTNPELNEEIKEVIENITVLNFMKARVLCDKIINDFSLEWINIFTLLNSDHLLYKYNGNSMLSAYLILETFTLYPKEFFNFLDSANEPDLKIWFIQKQEENLQSEAWIRNMLNLTINDFKTELPTEINLYTLNKLFLSIGVSNEVRNQEEKIKFLIKKNIYLNMNIDHPIMHLDLPLMCTNNFFLLKLLIEQSPNPSKEYYNYESGRSEYINVLERLIKRFIRFTHMPTPEEKELVVLLLKKNVSVNPNLNKGLEQLKTKWELS